MQTEPKAKTAATTVTQLVNDYSNVRPGPTILPRSLKIRDKLTRASYGSNNYNQNDQLYVPSLLVKSGNQ